MDNNLKDYREKELKNYVIGNALIIIVLLGIFNTLLDVKMDESTNNILLTLSSEIISAGIFSSILCAYVFILDAIIPGNWKDLICNLCRPLPGEIIFEEIREKANDKRFTKEKALQKYSNIYEIIDNLIGKEKRKASNDAWYSIVSAKYSCGFPNPQVSPIIVVDRYLDYFTTIMEDRLWQVLAKPVFRWRNRSGLSMNAARAA